MKTFVSRAFLATRTVQTQHVSARIRSILNIAGHSKNGGSLFRKAARGHLEMITMNYFIPYYVSERQSDVRGIECGWYTMDEHGEVGRRAVLEPRRMPRDGLAAERDADAVALSAQRPNRSGAPRGVRPRYSKIGAEEIVSPSAATSRRRTNADDSTFHRIPQRLCPSLQCCPGQLSDSALSLDDQGLVSAWRIGSPQLLDPRCAGRRENPSAIYRRCFPKCRGATPRVARDVLPAA